MTVEAVGVALSAARAVHLLPADALPGRLMRRLRDWRYGLGTFKVDYALSGPAPWTSADTRRAGVVHVGGSLAALFRAHQQAGAGQVPQDPSLVVGQHSLHDDSRAPAGRHTLYVYTHVPERLDVPPDEVVERVERRLEQFAPGFGRLVLARAVRTPRDIERENPSLVGGTSPAAAASSTSSSSSGRRPSSSAGGRPSQASTLRDPPCIPAAESMASRARPRPAP